MGKKNCTRTVVKPGWQYVWEGLYDGHKIRGHEVKMKRDFRKLVTLQRWTEFPTVKNRVK